jgi:hypothetical protein
MSAEATLQRRFSTLASLLRLEILRWTKFIPYRFSQWDVGVCAWRAAPGGCGRKEWKKTLEEGAGDSSWMVRCDHVNGAVRVERCSDIVCDM